MTPSTSPDLPAAAGAASMPAEAGDWAQATEARVVDAAVRLAAERRFDDRLVAAATAEAGLSEGEASLLLPEGARDVAALLWRGHDRAALAALRGVDPQTLKVRDRIRAAVLARVEAAAADEAAVKACSVFLMRPDNAPLAARLGWATADALWRWAGDTATDENHYSKRAILSAVLADVAMARLTQGREAAERRLDVRLEAVMRFEAWKAKQPKLDLLVAGAALLGRFRYRATG